MFANGQQVYFIHYDGGPVPVPEIVTVLYDTYDGYCVKLSNGYQLEVRPNELFTSHKKCLEAAIASATCRINYHQQELNDDIESLNTLRALYENEKDK